MADDWDANLAAVQGVIDNYDRIQRKALLAAAEAVAPRLAEAAPVRVSEKQGGDSLPSGTLKDSVRPHVGKDKESGQPQAIVDFGPYTWIAHIVDIGHQPPHSKIAAKLGAKVHGRPTPAHPFIRAVQDSERSKAQEVYTEAITQGMNDALTGKK